MVAYSDGDFDKLVSGSIYGTERAIWMLHESFVLNRIAFAVVVESLRRAVSACHNDVEGGYGLLRVHRAREGIELRRPRLVTMEARHL